MGPAAGGTVSAHRARRRGRAPEAALAGALLSTNVFLWINHGSEAFAQLALLVVAAGVADRCPPRPGTDGGRLAVAGLVGLVPVLRARVAGLDLVVLYALALALAYPLLGVAFYTWYAIPLLITATSGLAFAAGAVIRWAARGRRDVRRWLAATLVVGFLVPLVGHAGAVTVPAQGGQPPV